MTGRHVINLSTAWNPPREDGPWLRQFGRPAGNEPVDSLWLVVASPAGCDLALNGVRLPSVEPGETRRHAITGMLGVRNELAIVGRAGVDANAVTTTRHGRSSLPEAIARVWLEIETGPPAAEGSP